LLRTLTHLLEWKPQQRVFGEVSHSEVADDAGGAIELSSTPRNITRVISPRYCYDGAIDDASWRKNGGLEEDIVARGGDPVLL
jgi:hypothetical protein